MSNNPRFSENRRNAESGITFPNLLSRGMFDEEELVNALKVSSSIMNRYSSLAPPQPLPPKFIIAKAKRASARECDRHGTFSGQDLADIFEHQLTSDRDASVRTSFASRRYSNVGKGGDSHESKMSLISSADSTPENPSKMEDTPEIRGKSNSNSNSNSSSNSNSNINAIANSNNSSSNNNGQHMLSTAARSSSTQKVVGKRIDCFNNYVNVEAIYFDSNAPSTVNSNRNEQDGRIEHIDTIGPYDIICGRNCGAQSCVGNRRFRVTIMMNLKKYTDASTREDKTRVIKFVIDLLLDKSSIGARFIKRVGEGKYERLRDKQIREKVGHAFRDMHAMQQKGVKNLVAKWL